MPIQPGLALQVKGLELPDPLAMQAQATQIQNALQQQRMGEMQMQNAMREQRRAQELESIMSGVAPDAPAADVAGRLRQRGFVAQAGQVLEQEAKRRQLEREDEAAKLNVINKKAELMGRLFVGVKDQQSYSMARRQAIQRGYGTEQDIPEAYDPAVVENVLNGSMSVMDFVKNELDRRKTAATEATAQAAGVRAQAAASQAATAAGKVKEEKKTELQRLQELRDTLPPGSMQRTEVENRIDALGRSAAPTLTDVVDPDDPTRMLKVDARVYTGGGFTAPGVVGIAGKEPSLGKRAAEQATARSQFLDILDNLQANFDELNRQRAISSEQRGVVSNVLSSIEASGPGQVAGRAVGAKAQSLRDEIKSSRMALLSALKKITGKSASELNSNVELRLNLDAISDPSQTYEAATKILENLKQFYAQEPASQPAPGGRPGVTDRRSSTPRGIAPGESKGVVDFGSLK
jgi:hypothetical protein